MIALHPLDAHKLRRLGELLCEASLSDERQSWLPRVEQQVAELMMTVRDDCCADEARVVAERLVAAADWREGADRLGSAALVEILASASLRGAQA